jgi:hypothetical protein
MVCSGEASNEPKVGPDEPKVGPDEQREICTGSTMIKFNDIMYTY